ncbi:gephyrin-like molybdotransferase Glp [Thermocrinis minervae]|uniref:Molybdopterin molybdenumtransferase n=1 Tax=Thermocrinis minervae TaxID=381751 RepID=A0A1M6S841_9AQUI|nr:gephyrin-like molybdotransferase Glp [Thermocrinis minervae]SHK40866.1 molybdopterin molybdochelatase [Thermocrinis minervae]
MDLMPYEEALSIVLENTVLIGTSERLAFTECLGRVLAEDVLTDTDKPLFDNSAMDGYAVRSQDIQNASEDNPVRLEVIGEVAAGGEQTYTVKQGQAVKVFTGAPLPEGADCVVPVELTQRDGNTVLIKKALKSGANIRRKGEEVKAGEVLIKKGTVIRPYEIGLCASVNKAILSVYTLPKVAVLSTGDEIKDVGEPIEKPSQIRTSNNYTIFAMAKAMGLNVQNLGIVKDDPETIKKILSNIYDYDVFITTGGVSAGDKDFVKMLVREVGVDVKFHKVRIKPAKPILFGTYGKRGLFFGLPGNPVSCAIAFDLIVRPALLKMMGREDYMPTYQEAYLIRTFERKDADRREFVRARVWYENGKLLCDYSEKLQSHMLTSYVGMNAYMVVPEDVKRIEEGSRVKVVYFPWVY